MANIGQDEDFEAARQKAKKLGATDVRETKTQNNYLFELQFNFLDCD